MTVKQVGHFVVVEVPDLGLHIFWDRGTRVNVQVDQKWKNHVRKMLKPGTNIFVLQRNTVFHRSKACAGITTTIKWTIFKHPMGEYPRFPHCHLETPGSCSRTVCNRLKYE